MAKAGNLQLGEAKKQKKDEFYTQLADINAELRHYTQHFAGKVVFCNCDDPYESNFFKYFAANFNALKLKRLVATCYAGSSMAGRQLELDLFGGEKQTDLLRPDGLHHSEMASAVGANKSVCSQRIPHKIVINEVRDVNGDGRIDLADVEWLIKNDRNVLTRLEGDGDFRSAECVALLKEADIVVTNPPFSLFREYVAQLIQYGKKFLIIGNLNAMHYKEIFSLFKENKMWLGASIHSGDRKFTVPENYPLDAAGCGIDENGQRFIRVKGVRWFTNLDYKQRHEEFVYTRKYNPTDYPKYTNLDAIDVSESKAIPEDWEGLIGVPDTFLDIYNPDQFEIVGLGAGDLAKEIGVTKNFRGRTDVALRIDGKDKCPYSRIIIRSRK
jgi:hypothetical protein